MAEQSARAAPEEESIRLPDEAGYTRTKKKSRFKGNSDHGKDLRFGKKKPEKPKTARTISSSAMSARMHAAVESENQAAKP